MKKKITSLTLTFILGLFSWNATAQVAIYGATGIADGTSFTTLKGAFDAINNNTSDLSGNTISIRISDNTTETGVAAITSKGINTFTSAAGSGYVFPLITITGGTSSVSGSLTVTIVNGLITSIVMTGGTWTAVPTSLTIAAPTGGGGTQATARPTLSSNQVVFNITNSGSGYGPSAAFSGGGGSGAVVDVIMTSAASALSGAGPRTVTPSAVALTYALNSPGAGYTSNPSCIISGGPAGGSGATLTVSSLTQAANFSSLVVYPTVASKTISGTSGAPLIYVVGKTNVSIDGRLNQTGTPTLPDATSLTLSSSSTYNHVYGLDCDAQNNTIKYCNLKGSARAIATTGSVYIGGIASTTNGNGNNAIDYNYFSTLSGLPSLSAIYATGNTAKPNKGNLIRNNEFNSILPSYGNAIGINILGNATSNINDNYTISGNSMYGNLSTFAGGSRPFMQIGAAGNGGSHTITGNYIGGASAGCVGRMTQSSGGSNVVSHFVGIVLYTSATGTSLVQNNTVKNITWLTYAGRQDFNAIQVLGSGDATISGNIIGDNSTSANSSPSIIHSIAGNTAASFNGLNISTSGTVTCQSNQIGSIKAYNNSSSGTGAINFNGIWKSSGGNITISNNTIGSTTAASSIYATITNATLYSQGVICINMTGTGTANEVSNNTIANIANTTNTGNTYGIMMNGAAATSTVNGNLIHSIGVTGATTGKVIGIYSNLGTNTITNNILKLGDTNPVEIWGIGDATNATSTSVYHNTVYISGTPTSGTLQSSCVMSNGLTTSRNYKNNILVNARTTNGTHYALYSAATNTTSFAVDGNDYVASGTGGTLGYYNGAPKTTTHILPTTNDDNSVNEDPSFANAGGTLASDYIVSSAFLTGVTGTNVLTDYAGAIRRVDQMGAFFRPTVVPVNSNTTDPAGLTAATQLEVAAGVELTFTSSPNISRIILAPTAKLTMDANTITAPNGVIFQSDATGTATLTGDAAVSNATVQQYVTSGRNWYMSPSVSSPAYSMLNLGTSVVEWNEGTKVWDTKSSGTLVAGKGYIQVATSNPTVTGTTGTVNFTGTTNSGEITTPTLTRTGTEATSGFNLVGNPYPSYLRWYGTENNSVKEDNRNNGVGSSFWYRTKNEANAYIFVTHNGTSGYTIPANQTPTTTVNGIIPPMQAFWVRVNSTSTTMTFTNAMRLHADNNANKFKAPKVDERKRLRLQLANGTATDEALIYFDAAASNNFDNYDSPKMLNNSTTLPDLYSKAGNEKLVINGLAEATDNMTLPLGFTLKTAATGLTLKVSELSNFASGMKVYLLDSDQNTQTELLAETQYTFNTTTASSNNESRFSLLFRAPGVTTDVEKTNKLNAQVFVNAANQITIIAPEKSNYAIYNAMGQLMENGTTTSNYQTAKLQNGMYVVKVGNQSTRVIVK